MNKQKAIAWVGVKDVNIPERERKSGNFEVVGFFVSVFIIGFVASVKRVN